MSDYSFLTVHSCPTPQFEVADRSEVAFGVYELPVAWLAFFEPTDVVTMASSEEIEPGVACTCPSLLSDRNKALQLFQRRRYSLIKRLPMCLHEHVDALEKAVASTSGSYIQVVLTDMDEYVSGPESAEKLKILVEAIESEDYQKCERISHLIPNDNGGDISQYGSDAELVVNGIIGHLSGEFAIPLPIIEKPRKEVTHSKKPWWKFW